MRLNECSTILDEEKFVSSHQAIIEANKDKKFIKPYTERLDEYFERKGQSSDKNVRGLATESLPM